MEVFQYSEGYTDRPVMGLPKGNKRMVAGRTRKKTVFPRLKKVGEEPPCP